MSNPLDPISLLKKPEVAPGGSSAYSAEHVEADSKTTGGTINNFQTPNQPADSEQSLETVRSRIRLGDLKPSYRIEELHPSQDRGIISAPEGEQPRQKVFNIATKKFAKVA